MSTMPVAHVDESTPLIAMLIFLRLKRMACTQASVMRFTCEPVSQNPRTGDEKAPLLSRNRAKTVPRHAEMFSIEGRVAALTIASEMVDFVTGSSSASLVFAAAAFCDCYTLLLERRG